jgi:hypothetical protein
MVGKGGRTLSKEDDGGHQGEEAERASDLKELSDAFLDVRERPSDVHASERGGEDSSDARQKQGGAAGEEWYRVWGRFGVCFLIRGCFLITGHNRVTWLMLRAFPAL